MRLWHQSLLPYLPRSQILGQHREIAALRGKGWGRPHSTVNYVFNHSMEDLVAYHYIVIDEMKHRGYNVDPKWLSPHYRGKKIPPSKSIMLPKVIEAKSRKVVYKEHNNQYFMCCIDNLLAKDIPSDSKEKLVLLIS